MLSTKLAVAWKQHWPSSLATVLWIWNLAWRQNNAAFWDFRKLFLDIAELIKAPFTTRSASKTFNMSVGSLSSCWPAPHPPGHRGVLCLVCGHRHHRGCYLLLHEASGEATRSEVDTRRHRRVGRGTKSCAEEDGHSQGILVRIILWLDSFNIQCQILFFCMLLYFFF